MTPQRHFPRESAGLFTAFPLSLLGDVDVTSPSAQSMWKITHLYRQHLHEWMDTQRTASAAALPWKSAAIQHHLHLGL